MHAALLGSAWRSRLWTYLEAYVSRKLMNCVKNGIVLIREGGRGLLFTLAGAVYKHMSIVAEDLKRKIESSNCATHHDNKALGSLEDRPAGGYRRLLRAIEPLKATQAGDEMIVLANILILPALSILEAQGEQRVAAFYQALGHIP